MSGSSRTMNLSMRQFRRFFTCGSLRVLSELLQGDLLGIDFASDLLYWRDGLWAASISAGTPSYLALNSFLFVQ